MDFEYKPQRTGHHALIVGSPQRVANGSKRYLDCWAYQLGFQAYAYKREPRPSSYPLLGPKYPLLGTIYPQLRVQGGSWNTGHKRVLLHLKVDVVWKPELRAKNSISVS